jgi:hypothetical protein
MPIVKTEVAPKTRANVAYAAALVGMSESEIYGYVLDTYAGTKSPDDLVRILEKAIEKEELVNATDGDHR